MPMTNGYYLIAIVLASVVSNTLTGSDGGEPMQLGLGRVVDEKEIAIWDVDIMTDGTGLPMGSGTTQQGKQIYDTKCDRCHGQEGAGGPYDRLVGRIPEDGFPFALDPTAPKTIGSYWPYATTVFDYIRRAMPFDAPGSLTDEEVFDLVAYLLYLNEIVSEEYVLTDKNLPTIRMPARDRFVPDDRKGGPEVR